MKQAILCWREQCQSGRWLIIIGGLLLQALMMALVIKTLPMAKLREDPGNHVMAIAIAIIFCLSGIVIFFRISILSTATLAYSVFVCASLIFCLLNLNDYCESMVAMSLLSVVVYGQTTTCVCQIVSLTNRPARNVRILTYAPLVLSFTLCLVALPMLFLSPTQWIATTLLIYVFPFACMVIITWNIFSYPYAFKNAPLGASASRSFACKEISGLRQTTGSNSPVDGMTLIGMVFVLLSLSIISAKSTPYHITYLLSTAGFLLFYAVFAACLALYAGIIFWVWQHMLLQILRIIISIIFVGILLLLALRVLRFPDGTLTFLHTSLENFLAYHLFSIPLFVLPVIVCYSLIYHQLSGHVSLLSRHFIRGALWFLLASCFVVSEVIASVLAVQHWNDHAEITLVCAGWLFFSCWLFPLFWEKIRAIGDSMFYRDFYHYNRTLRDLSLALTRLRDLDQICTFLLPRLTMLLNTTGAALVIWQEEGEQQYRHEAFPGALRETSPLLADHCTAAHFTGPRLVNGLLLLPLYDGKSLRGCLCLGEKLNSELYSRQDKSFLETLAAQLAILVASARYLDQVHAHARQVVALNHRMLLAQEEERRRLALELHDDTLQQAMLLVRQLTDLGRDPRLARPLALARSLTDGLRSTCLELRPPLLDELGLPDALHWLARQAGLQSGIAITFQLRTPASGLLHRLPHEIELTLYRVCQEALSNATRHAQASLVRVRLRHSCAGAVSLLVVDNGQGLQRTRPSTSSLGMVGMVERIKAIDGRLSLRSRRGRGVAIHALCWPMYGQNMLE